MSKTVSPTFNLQKKMEIALHYHQAGDLVRAATCYRQILQVAPHHQQALHLLGLIAYQTRRYEEATHLMNQAIAQGASPECYGDLGNVLREQQKFAEAAETYYRAIQLKPPLIKQYGSLLADVLKKQGRLEEAIRCYQQLLLCYAMPHQEAIHNNLANIFKQQGQFEPAIDHLKQALQIKPNYFNAHNNLANIYKELGQLTLATRHYQYALTLQPNSAEVHNNLATLLHAQGQLTTALQHYETALTHNPNLIDIHHNKTRIFLSSGQFVQGWREHLWRPSRTKDYVHLPLLSVNDMTHLPEDLTQQHFLLQAEQGLGDELFFLRFAPTLKARGATLSYRYHNPKIASILQRQAWLEQLIAPETQVVPTVNHTLLIGDLPLALDMTDVTQIPPPLTLSPLPARQIALQDYLRQCGPPPYIGLTWRAGTLPQTQQKNSFAYQMLYKEIALTTLSPIFHKLKQGTVLALQRHLQTNEIETLADLIHRPVHDVSHFSEDLEDMLALLAHLTAYIGVSNTNIYLLAGLGKTAQVLIPNPPDWRWMATGATSPWFAGFNVYRQSADKSWSTALQHLTANLTQMGLIVC